MEDEQRKVHPIPHSMRGLVKETMPITAQKWEKVAFVVKKYFEDEEINKKNLNTFAYQRLESGKFILFSLVLQQMVKWK